MAEFTDTDLMLLRRLAGRMIPASEEFSVPGADDASIQADIATTLSGRADTVQAMLTRLGGAALAAAPDGQIDSVIASHLAAEPALNEVLVAVITCYYRDDRVLCSLGMPTRPPYPEGFEVDQGDWSLLDPVRARPKIWRDVLRT
jgi:hypothetical protein